MVDVPLALTRYLYFKDEVECSLLHSILDGNLEEALFWTYELYYSGFEIDALAILAQTYADYYKAQNPKLETFLRKVTVAWLENRNLDWNVGTIVRNMAGKPHSNMVVPGPEKKFYITLTETDIDKYITRVKAEPDGSMSTNILLKIKSYTTHRHKLSSYYEWKRPRTIDIPDKYDQEYWSMKYTELCNNWLYWASFTPIWAERIREYGGALNPDTNKIIFEDEDREDEFHDLYSHDIDELSTAIKCQRAEIA